MSIISDTSITEILSSDDVVANIANAPHDELQGFISSLNEALSAEHDDTGHHIGDTTIKAWINFDGTGAATIRDSYNISSIAYNGIGDYTINWDTDFANTYYAVAGSAGEAVTSKDNIFTINSSAVGSVVVVLIDASTSSADDSGVVSVIAIGDQ